MGVCNRSNISSSLTRIYFNKQSFYVVRVILASRKSCIFAVKLFGRWLKSSGKLVKHATDQTRAENEQVRTKRLVKNTREKLRRNHVVLLQKCLQKQESVKLQCVELSKKTSEPILTKI